MPITDLTPEEVAAFEESESAVSAPERKVGALDYAAAFNRGVAESVPGAPRILRGAGFYIKQPEEDIDAPPTLGEGAMRMAGTGAGVGAQLLAAPLVAGTQTISRGMQMLRGFIADYQKGATGARLAKEVVTNAGVGAVGAAAYEGTRDPSSQAAAEFAAALTMPAAAAYSKVAPTAWVAKKVMELRNIPTGMTGADQLNKYSSKAVLTAAEKLHPVVRGNVTPQDLPEGLAGQLTTAEQSQNPQLLALQRAVLRGNPDAAVENAGRVGTINDVIKNGAAGVGVGPAGKLSPDVARKQLNDLVEGRIAQAKEAIDTKLSSVAPGRGPDVASADAVKIAQKAQEEAEVLERTLWGRLNRSESAPTANLAEALKTYEAKLGESRIAEMRKDLPADVSAMLDEVLVGPKAKVGVSAPTGNAKVDAIKARMANMVKPATGPAKPPTFGELQDLRSTILEASRAEQAKRITGSANERMISNLNNFQSALLEDMSAAAGNGADATIARNFSADMRQRFGQTDISDWVNKRRTGEVATPPTMALETTVGRTGEKGALSLDTLKDAVTPRAADLTKGAPTNAKELQGAAEDYLASRFLKETTVQGAFSTTSARSFMSKYEPVLARTPELKARLDEAIAAGDVFKVRAALKDETGAAANILLRGKFDMGRLINSADPAKAANDIVVALKADKSGVAMESATQATVESLLKSAESNGVLSGVKLLEELDRPAVKAVTGRLMSKQQVESLRRWGNAARLMENAKSGPVSDAAELAAKKNPLINFVQRVVGAKLASELNKMSPIKGGGIQVAAEGSALATRMAEKSLDAPRKLIRDAVLSKDPALLNAILRYRPGQKMPPAAKTWMISMLAQYGVQKEQPEQE